ncbi:hypothetical protein GCM10023259_046010 [Thermocatellispora tengchongensis]
MEKAGRVKARRGPRSPAARAGGSGAIPATRRPGKRESDEVVHHAQPRTQKPAGRSATRPTPRNRPHPKQAVAYPAHCRPPADAVEGRQA